MSRALNNAVKLAKFVFADQYDSLQDAVDTGLDVFIPESDDFYDITAALALNSNQRLYGEGARSKIRQLTANTNVISATSKTGVVVEGVLLHAPGTFSSYANGAGVALIGCSDSAVRNVTVENHRGAGVLLYNSNDCEVAHNKFRDSPVEDLDLNTECLADIAVVYSSSRNKIHHNTCESGNGTGVQIQTVLSGDTCDDNVVDHNTIRNCKAYGIIAYRIAASYPADNHVRRTVITGNTIVNTAGTIENTAVSNYSYGAGIYIQGAEDATVTGNTLNGTHTGAVTFAETLAPGAIGVTNQTRCTITGNVIEDAGMFGIDIGDGNSLGEPIGVATVSGNVISNCTRGGIHVRNRGKINITGNGIDTTADSGIEVNNSSLKPDISIDGNKLRNITATAAIEVKYAEGANVCNNQINTASTHGITAANSTVLNVSGNMIRNHATRGIQIASTSSVAMVSDNLIIGTGSSSEGIRLDVASLYSGNRISGCTSPWAGSFAPWQTLTVNSATPSVADAKECITNNSSSTTITNFTGGYDGQEIQVVFTDANTTLDFSGSSLKGNGGVDRAMAAGDAIRAVYRASSSLWYVTVIDI